MAVIQSLRDALAEFRQDGPLMEKALAAFGMTAIVMLSITLLRMDGGYTFAAPPASSTFPLLPWPEGAAPYDCQRLRNGQALRAIVMQRDRHGFEWHDCYYGSDTMRTSR